MFLNCFSQSSVPKIKMAFSQPKLLLEEDKRVKSEPISRHINASIHCNGLKLSEMAKWSKCLNVNSSALICGDTACYTISLSDERMHFQPKLKCYYQVTRAYKPSGRRKIYSIKSKFMLGWMYWFHSFIVSAHGYIKREWYSSWDGSHYK